MKLARPRDEHAPAWRLPFLVDGRSDLVMLRRKAPWYGDRLPAVGERMNLLALHTDRRGDDDLRRFNLTVDRVEWGVAFDTPPAHVPMFTFAAVEGDESALQSLCDAGWEPEVPAFFR